MTPQAEAVPHPTIEGAYTVSDAIAAGGHIPFFASKASAEIAASKRNEQRRDK